MAGGALGVGTADVPLGRKEATGDSAALLRAPICHAQSPCGQAAAAGAAHAPLEGAGALSGEAEGETAALLHGPPSAAHAPGAPRSAGGRAGLGGAALELEGGGEQVDGRAVVARVHWHILPLFFLLALLCSVDRANLSFAALQLNADLGFSRTVFGFGSGVFFVGYSLLQILTPMACARFGAPAFLGGILMLWGGVTLLFAFMRTAAQFYALRFLLGVAESGMWYHLALFCDDRELGLAYTAVASATSLAGLVGAPLAAGLLLLDGACGLRGWQWLFLVESAPAVALGLVVRWRLARSPQAAAFLRPAERAWLLARKAPREAAPAALGAAASDGSIWAPLLTVLASPHIWCLAAIWSLVCMGMDGIGAGAGGALGDAESERQRALGRMVQAALLAGVPFGAAAVAMVANAQLAKRSGERHWHGAAPLLAAAAAFAALAVLLNSSGNGDAGAAGAFAALTAAAMGVWSVHGPLLSWPAAFLSGTTAASGFALVKTVGSLGSFAGPALIGALADVTGGFAAPCLLLAACALAGAAMLLGFRAPGAEPAAGLGWLARLLDPERRRLRRGEAAARAPKRSRSDPVIAEAGLARSAGASDAGAQAARAAAPGLAPLRAEQAAHLNS